MKTKRLNLMLLQTSWLKRRNKISLPITIIILQRSIKQQKNHQRISNNKAGDNKISHHHQIRIRIKVREITATGHSNMRVLHAPTVNLSIILMNNAD